MIARPLTERLFTEAEYLMIEAQSTYRSEFRNGRIYAMTGGTPEHALIAGNIHTALNIQVMRRGCRVYTSDLLVRTGNGNNYYPDVSAVCGEPVFKSQQGKLVALTNPQLIVEVLSDSTEHFDRGEKLLDYETISDLQYYLLIEQHTVRAELHTRLSLTDWNRHIATDLEEVLELPALNAKLALKDVYFNTLYAPAAS